MKLSGVLVGGALACLVGCLGDRAQPATAPSGAQAPTAPADSTLQPNADAVKYGPHGVAVTPTDEAAKAPAPPASPAAGDAADDDAPASADEARGHACECGKTCHCGHCAGAIPGCHCHVKRADHK